MCVSFGMDGNKQEGKQVKCKALKWDKTNNAPLKRSL
jgi:hypothetical protein